ncbi:protein phosphatase 1 regulatory subunit 3C [Pholidichthys leucotaenia]
MSSSGLTESWTAVELKCSVLHDLSHPQHAVLPDLAMCLSVGHCQPLYHLLSMSNLEPTLHWCQPTDYPRKSIPHSLQPSSPFSSCAMSKPRSCFRRDSSGAINKCVTFADAKGLALTAMRHFIPEHSLPAPTLVMRPSSGQLEFHKLKGHKPRLGFPPPLLDFPAFLARLRDMNVQLGSCSVSEHSLGGRVFVCHVSSEKAVNVRVTFDSWQSHHDIPCMFMRQLRCGGSDVDFFSFDLSLPHNMDPKEKIEFCVLFRPGSGSATYWDDNRGQNYRVCLEKDGSIAESGYPTPSNYRPPLSRLAQVPVRKQSYAGLLYLQRRLSCNRRMGKVQV